ncbi:MAG: hypothetical protein JJT78_02390 [Leptospira sp.]|nr:hypothetical protein [Leptospira sp.]
MLDKKIWKNYFRTTSWQSDEVLEADSRNLFIYLNSYRIPKEMDWQKPAWGLWNVAQNTFTPLENIPSNLIPVRKVGNTVFIRNKNRTGFYIYDIAAKERPKLIQSSVKIRGWFPRSDGSVAYILEGEDCKKIQGAKVGIKFSICLLGSDYETIDSIALIERPINAMILGNSDNYIAYWTKDPNDKLWVLKSVNLDNNSVQTVTRSNRGDYNKSETPKWISWMKRNWVLYERVDMGEEKESTNRAFILHNVKSGQKKEVLLERKGKILLEPGNIGNRTYNYSPFLVVMDYSGEDNPIKIIDIEELKIVFETIFPLENTLSEKYEQAVFYP